MNTDSGKNGGCGTLYLVATPIGNLEDMTLRAVRVLREADLIACEDTRTSRPLLAHYEITTPTTSYHKFNEKQKSEALTDALLSGKNVALITDAGMPVISDPGYVLVRACLEQGIPVTAVPGASASVTALALSGQDSRRFVFEGFLPDAKEEKKERRARLAALAGETRTIVLYASPHHLKADLADLSEALGSERQLTVCREMTKKFETVTPTTFSEMLSRIGADSGQGAAERKDAEREDTASSAAASNAAAREAAAPRGEYVLVIAGRPEEELREAERNAWASLSAGEHVRLYEEEGYDRKEAMRLAARDRGVTKREIYQALLKE